MFVPGKSIQAKPIFSSKAGAYQSDVTDGALLGLLINLKNLPETNTLAYSAAISVAKKKVL